MIGKRKARAAEQQLAALERARPDASDPVLRALLELRSTPVRDERETANVAAMRQALGAREARPAPRLRRAPSFRLQLVAAAVLASLAATSGLALVGSLPGAAQTVAEDVLETMGIEVPGPNDEAGTAPEGEPTVAEPNPASSHGGEVSDTARSDETSGRDKGEDVADEASEGRSTTRGTDRPSPPAGVPADAGESAPAPPAVRR